MCTPIGHSIAGCSIVSGQQGRTGPARWILLIAIIMASNLPDIDFVFGYIAGNPNLYHHLWTHSLFFMLMSGVIFGIAYRVLEGKGGFKAGLVVCCIVFSHLVLDFITGDSSTPYGMQLFWPVSRDFFISPITLFRDVSKASSSQAFLGSLFCWHNAWTVLLEVAILGPFYLGVRLWRSFRKG